ncbi:peroxidase 43-like [Salvia miltiorrhiza]|uniref:peroxidase 43-like n=1 Tax=Salvia miltiorrhiza TaxID=226208 RepID=UPI0025AB695B|nr:peroxidase 43-like [Salvia miltiorrhiza]
MLHISIINKMGVFVVLVLLKMSYLVAAQLQVGFYAKSCPNVEAIVGGVVREAAASDQTSPAVLLRLHFHDCFVEGCDGSILIDNGAESDEKHAFGHQGVRGFDIVERAKAELEALCPRTVSCADILALAAREALLLAKGASYEVETGRRDGVVSNVESADNMPDATDSIQTLKTKFLQKGLTEKDLVVLSGAHTIGTTACFFMSNRLYNFPADGGSDPSINPSFLPELKSMCPKNGDVNVRLPIDRGSEQVFDSQILQNIRSGFAVLQSDAALYQDDATKAVIDSYFAPLFAPSFESDFADSMVRMGRIGVLTGLQGTIRRTCATFD